MKPLKVKILIRTLRQKLIPEYVQEAAENPKADPRVWIMSRLCVYAPTTFKQYQAVMKPILNALEANKPIGEALRQSIQPEIDKLLMPPPRVPRYQLDLLRKL